MAERLLTIRRACPAALGAVLLAGTLAGAFAVGAPAVAQVAETAARPGLPPDALVMEAIAGHPAVQAAAARVDAARARQQMLARGPYEIELGGAFDRRTIDNEGRFSEYEASLSRPFRLPGKAALDRRAGALDVDAARARHDEVRHRTTLLFSTLWHDWLTAASHHRNDQATVQGLEQAVAAVRRRLTLRDAAQLDLDHAQSALAQARAQAANARAGRDQARILLLAAFPALPLPVEPPELADPVFPRHQLDMLRARIVAHSHEADVAGQEADRLDVVARRMRADRVGDPSFGVRLFSERGGEEKGAGIMASIPLGGGHRRAAAREAEAEARAARFELTAVRREAEAMADVDVSNARTRFEAWEQAAIATRETVSAARKVERGHQLGQLDLDDVLYAYRQANEARSAEIDARSEAARALTQLLVDAHVIWSAGRFADLPDQSD